MVIDVHINDDHHFLRYIDPINLCIIMTKIVKIQNLSTINNNNHYFIIFMGDLGSTPYIIMYISCAEWFLPAKPYLW